MIAELKVYQIKEKNKWVKYLPSLAITYNIQGHPRPSLSYNPLAIMKTNEESQLRDLSIESIKLRYVNLIREKLIELENQILDFKIDKASFETERELMAIDQKLMMINEEKYKANLIKPSTYLKEKKKYLKIEQEIQRKEHELKKVVNRICQAAKYAR